MLETVNLSDTPSAVAGRIEREEVMMLLKGGKQGANAHTYSTQVGM